MSFIETRNKLENLRKQIRSGKISYEAGVKTLSEGDKSYTKNLGIFALVVGILGLYMQISSFSSGGSVNRLIAISPVVFLPFGFVLFRTRNYALLGKKGFYTSIIFYIGLTGVVIAVLGILFRYFYDILFYTSILVLIISFIVGKIRKIHFSGLLNERV